MDTRRAGTFALLFGLLCVGVVGLTVGGMAGSEESTVGTDSGDEFNVTGLDVPPTVEGELLTVTAEITNEGDESGEETVELSVDGIGSNDTAVALDAGESDDVELTVETEIGDALNSPYTVTVTAGENSLTAEAAVNLPTVGENPPQDSTGDGLYDDVGGSGELEITDVQLLFENLDELDAHAWAFDFAGLDDQEVTIFDVQALFNNWIGQQDFFSVELTDVPGSVEEGEDIEVGYEVENTGGEMGSQDIVFEVDGNSVDSNDGVELAPGDSVADSFTYTTGGDDVPGVTVGVASDDDSATADVDVDALGDEKFEISLTDVPESVVEGDDIAVSYEVENTGDQTGTQDIIFEVDGDEVDSNDGVELEPDATSSDSFTYTTDGDDVPSVTVGVASDDDSATADVAVDALGDADFEVSLTDVPDEVIEGEDIEVGYEIENTGEQTDTQDIVFEVDGDQQDAEEEVELEPGDTFSDTFTYTTDSGDVPSVDLTVSSETDSATASVTVTGADDFELRGTLSNETAAVGETVTVEYTVVSETGEEKPIAGYRLEIEYDSDILAFESVGGRC